jgi:transcriptional regulator with XRE-family HTH domain
VNIRTAARRSGEEHAPAARCARDLSQEALAHESGIDRTHVSSIERAKRGVSIDIVGRIAKALAVRAVKLLKDG